MKKLEIKEMRRFELLTELRTYAHPLVYLNFLDKSTPFLKSVVTFYREGGKDEEWLRMAEVLIEIGHRLGLVCGKRAIVLPIVKRKNELEEKKVENHEERRESFNAFSSRIPPKKRTFWQIVWGR